jgi:hypothetical protein
MQVRDRDGSLAFAEDADRRGGVRRPSLLGEEGVLEPLRAWQGGSSEGIEESCSCSRGSLHGCFSRWCFALLMVYVEVEDSSGVELLITHRVSHSAPRWR